MHLLGLKPDCAAQPVWLAGNYCCQNFFSDYVSVSLFYLPVLVGTDVWHYMVISVRLPVYLSDSNIALKLRILMEGKQLFAIFYQRFLARALQPSFLYLILLTKLFKKISYALEREKSKYCYALKIANCPWDL